MKSTFSPPNCAYKIFYPRLTPNLTGILLSIFLAFNQTSFGTQPCQTKPTIDGAFMHRPGAGCCDSVIYFAMAVNFRCLRRICISRSVGPHRNAREIQNCATQRCSVWGNRMWKRVGGQGFSSVEQNGEPARPDIESCRW